MEMVRTGRRIADGGLAPGTSGNLSRRLDARRFLMTRTGVSLAELTLDDIIEMDTAGAVAGRGEPSSEWRLHAQVYAETAHSAVLHCHPAAIIAVSLDSERWTPPTREAAFRFPEIRVLEHEGPNMLEPSAAVECLTRFGAVVLRAHGLVLAGNNLAPMARLAEMLEDAARIALYARTGAVQ
jgi:L-fuculose-phosphate aldolase